MLLLKAIAGTIPGLFFMMWQGLIEFMGGNKNFVAMLDSVFELPPVFDESYYGSVIHEIREMQIATWVNMHMATSQFNT